MVVDNQFFNQADDAYLGKTLVLDDLSWKILASPEKPGIWLTGPARWTSGKGGRYPLAILWKSSTKQNIGVSPETHGHILLSHASSGNPVLKKMLDMDKLPLPGDESRPNSLPPEEDEQFSVGESWYDIDDAILATRAGKWVAAFISGSKISNVHTFTVRPLDNPQPAAPKGNRKAPTPEELQPFLAGANHPKPPAEGIAYSLAKEGEEETPMLYGSFAFKAQAEEEPLLHLGAFVSGPDYLDMLRIGIQVPVEATTVEDGMRIGHFALDLKRTLGNPRLDIFRFPEEAFMTLAGRDWIGQPFHLDPAAFA
jgi:hypothetical protein